MREFDEKGLNLANAQASLFHDSVEMFDGSSKVFIRCYMNSDQCSMIDRFLLFDRAVIISELNEKYELDRGKKKYEPEIMNWMGYLYRYWSYTYELPSRTIYKMILPEELYGLYYPYHSLDPKTAIERIYDAKALPQKEEATVVMERIFHYGERFK